MIGHLQSNKAGKAVEIFHTIDSLDSAKLGDRLNAAALKIDKIVGVLIEINIGGEEAKSGIAPDSPDAGGNFASRSRLVASARTGSDDCTALHRRSRRRTPLLPPSARIARPAGSRESCRPLHFELLSMGMSHDFEVAIEEGSTCVRVGDANFRWILDWPGDGAAQTP